MYSLSILDVSSIIAFAWYSTNYPVKERKTKQTNFFRNTTTSEESHMSMHMDRYGLMPINSSNLAALEQQQKPDCGNSRLCYGTFNLNAIPLLVLGDALKMGLAHQSSIFLFHMVLFGYPRTFSMSYYNIALFGLYFKPVQQPINTLISL